jgi:glycerate kinase
MKAVIAIDPFKGSLTSLEAGEAVRAGILAANPGAEVLVRPLADGREGTVEALTRGMGGTFRTVQVTGPLSDPIEARCGILADGRTAIVEMSAATGITLVPEEKRNPLHTTTCGVGEILRDAIRQGCRSFVVGIGGSATNDGGSGRLQALGFGMLDREGQQVFGTWRPSPRTGCSRSFGTAASGLPATSPIPSAGRRGAPRSLVRKRVRTPT